MSTLFQNEEGDNASASYCPRGSDRKSYLPSTRPEGDAQPRSGQPVRRSAARSRSGRQAQHRALPRRLHVPTQRRRVQELEITDCEFKLGGLRRAAPYAFTEQGVAMLSSV